MKGRSIFYNKCTANIEITTGKGFWKSDGDYGVKSKVKIQDTCEALASRIEDLAHAEVPKDHYVSVAVEVTKTPGIMQSFFGRAQTSTFSISVPDIDQARERLNKELANFSGMRPK